MEKGWTSYADFACAISATAKDNDDLFVEKITKHILGTTGTPAVLANPHLAPRVQRLFLLSYTVHAAELERFAQPPPERATASIHAVDRAAALTALNSVIIDFEVFGENEPSHKLTNKMAAILLHGVVKYIGWEQCNSRVAEIQDQDDEPGLRLSTDGTTLIATAPKQADADVATELKWELAMRRRAIAMHVAGLCTYATAVKWTEKLKQVLLAPPPPLHRRVTWQQLRAADALLWERVAGLCRETCKKKAGESATEFEKHFKKEIDSLEVRHCLLPSPSGSAGSHGEGDASGLTRRLENRLKQAEQTIAAQKRRLDGISSHGGGGGPPRAKAKANKGNGKGKAKGDGKFAEYRELGYSMKHGSTHVPICFGYNLPSGCSAASAGQKCQRGWHICGAPGCQTRKEPHSATSHS